MSAIERLRCYGVALLAPRTSVLGYDPCGGSEVVLWEDVHILQQKGIPVRVYARAAKPGLPVTIIPTHVNAPLLTSIEYCGQFVIKERKAVLIAYNEPSVAGLAPERTIVRFDWSTPLPRYWRFPGWCSRFRKAIYLFPSESERCSFLNFHYGISRMTTVVIPNAVDLKLFYPYRRHTFPGLRVGYAGQWSLQKGILTLLEAWHLLKKELPLAELWLAGSFRLWKSLHIPKGVQEIRTYVETQLITDERIKVVGELPRKRMPEFWNSVDVAAVPSLYESFGLTALEAMACATPVVASRVGGLQEIIIDRESGLLVPPGDADALAGAIITLLTDPALRQRLAQGARRRAEAFSIECRAKSLISLVEAVASRAEGKSLLKLGEIQCS